MLRRTASLALLIAATAACSERALPTAPSSFHGPVEVSKAQQYPGILESPTRLRMAGEVFALAGWQTALFRNLTGAEVVIYGVMDPDPLGGIVIEEFQILAVDGHTVLDGVLGATEEGYFVKTLDGTMATLGDAPEALYPFLGKRLWIVHVAGETQRFGVLELM